MYCGFQVYLSHNKDPLKSKFPSNVEQVPGLKSLSGSCAILNDDTTRSIDDVIFCTGYHYKFDFLPSDCATVSVDDDEVVSPLYRHLISIEHPESLFFIGIPKTICPFPFFHSQMRAIAAILQRHIQLPAKDVMRAEAERELKERMRGGMPRRYAHSMGARQWDYLDDLAEFGGFEKLPRYLEKLYTAVHKQRHIDSKTYKLKNYVITSDSDFKTVT